MQSCKHITNRKYKHIKELKSRVIAILYINKLVKHLTSYRLYLTQTTRNRKKLYNKQSKVVATTFIKFLDNNLNNLCV